MTEDANSDGDGTEHRFAGASDGTEHRFAGASGVTELRIDGDRYARTGIAEAVYAPGKSPRQCAEAVAALLAVPNGGPVLLTRAEPEQAAAAAALNPGSISVTAASQTLIWRSQPRQASRTLVLTAGTADLPVAHEAVAVLAAYGVTAELVADVGVAGIHRILLQQNVIRQAELVIVVAGMEGALASVVAGMTRAPVIAVPTSTGYGAGLEGVTALLAMLASCSPGITVVGIDNGFGAGCAALRYLNGNV
jgi:NCAIR mutase (PurE)-related protein